MAVRSSSGAVVAVVVGSVVGVSVVGVSVVVGAGTVVVASGG
jgi:hypothetical protein